MWKYFAHARSAPDAAPGIEHEEIAGLMESSADSRTKADKIEGGIAADAETLINLFLAGDTCNVVIAKGR